MGFMARKAGRCGEDVAASGIGLAFMTFPTAISELPALNALFGVCFFGALLTAGITSMVSILQTDTIVIPRQVRHRAQESGNSRTGAYVPDKYTVHYRCRNEHTGYRR